MPKKRSAKHASPKTTRSVRAMRIALPATSANLGPAFDAAALAMNLYISVEARTAKNFSIRATGRDEQICGSANHDQHLIFKTYSEILSAQRLQVSPLALRIKNNIPIGKGCGSSAAARLAGIALANHFGRLRWSDSRIIGEASRLEHHADNASACWMGGLTIACVPSEGTAQVVCIRPKGNWPLLLAIPQKALSTEEARSVLPSQYSRADAVANIQNSMLLLAAFTQGQPQLLSGALHDRIHQPYRAALCPLLPSLQKLTGRDGVLGVALSGAGPSVLVFLDPAASSVKSRSLVATHLQRDGLDAELLLTSIALRGARRRT